MKIENRSYPYLRMRLQCMLQTNRYYRDAIIEASSQVGICCPSSSSTPPSSSSPSSSSPSSAPSSSSSIPCEFENAMIYDEWKWDQGTDNGSGQGVDTWTGLRNSKILTTYPSRPDSTRAKVQDGCILINGSPSDKRAYHAQFPTEWYDPLGPQTAYSNAIFAVVEIDLFKELETTLWNHMITGESNSAFSTFSSQTSSNTIGSRTNSSVYFSIERPLWILPGVQRYIVEMRYGQQGSGIFNDFTLLLNGYGIINTSSPYAVRNIFGVGVVAPQDLAANSTLDRRLLSILALKNPSGLDQRLPVSVIQQARQYLSCVWEVPLQV